jgi:hypothetical protein
LLWLVPFLESASTLPLLIWTLSIPVVFFVWYSHTLGHAWIVPGWILLLEYGPVTAAATIVWFRGRFTSSSGGGNTQLQFRVPILAR